MRKKILLLTQWFDPEPTIKGMRFARSLVEKGFDVEVLTGFPNYPQGKIYEKYKIKILQRELIDGVYITRVPLYPSHNKSIIKRFLNYVSFSLSALVYSLFFASRPDVIYVYHPPLTVCIVACIVRFFRGIPVVCDVQDIWPDALLATGMLKNKSVLKLLKIVSGWVYAHVDQIVVLSPGFKNLLLKRGVPSSKVEVIYNWADEISMSSSTDKIPQNFPSENRFKVMFAGNIGKAQGLSFILDVARVLEQKKSKVTFILIGDGIELDFLKLEVIKQNLTNVFFLPFVSLSEVGAYLNAADVLLVHLRKTPLFQITIPSKTQAYMFMAKPIIMAVDGDAAELVRESGGGVVVEPENMMELINAIQFLEGKSKLELSDMGGRGAEYYKKNLAFDNGMQKFEAIFRELVKQC